MDTKQSAMVLRQMREELDDRLKHMAATTNEMKQKRDIINYRISALDAAYVALLEL